MAGGGDLDEHPGYQLARSVGVCGWEVKTSQVIHLRLSSSLPEKLSSFGTFQVFFRRRFFSFISNVFVFYQLPFFSVSVGRLPCYAVKKSAKNLECYCVKSRKRRKSTVSFDQREEKTHTGVAVPVCRLSSTKCWVEKKESVHEN